MQDWRLSSRARTRLTLAADSRSSGEISPSPQEFKTDLGASSTMPVGNVGQGIWTVIATATESILGLAVVVVGGVVSAKLHWIDEGAKKKVVERCQVGEPSSITMLSACTRSIFSP